MKYRTISGDGVEVFSREELEDRLGDAIPVDQIVEVFLVSGANHLASLKEAVAEGDVDNFLAIAHTLKGTAASLAAHRMEAVTTAMESIAILGSLAGARELVSLLELEFEAFKEAVAAR
ncbi:hypothetical protein GMSM_28720 [Geomonas sp. Red276]